MALRQLLDLYVCLRPVRWFAGVPSPVVHPEKVDMVIFRENTEDVYAGLELQEGTDEARRLISYLEEQFGWTIRADSGIGIKPISETGLQASRPRRAELRRAPSSRSVTFMHKGNIQKFTEGAFRNWGYELVRDEFSDVAVAWDDCGGDPGDKILVKDAIADITFQQVLTRPDEFDVIAATNLNGDYLSDAARGPSRGHRDRARRQHQLRDGPRSLRGDTRHGAEVRRPGQGQPRLAAAVRRAHVRALRLAGRPRTTSSRRSSGRSRTRS